MVKYVGSGPRTISATSNPSIAVLVGPQPLCSILRKTLSSQSSSRSLCCKNRCICIFAVIFNFHTPIPSARAYCLARCLFCVTSCNGTSLSLSLTVSMSFHVWVSQEVYLKSKCMCEFSWILSRLSTDFPLLPYLSTSYMASWTLQQASMWCPGSLYWIKDFALKDFKFQAQIAMSLCWFTFLLESLKNATACAQVAWIRAKCSLAWQCCLWEGDHTIFLIAPAWDVPGGFVLTKYSSFCAAKSFFALECWQAYQENRK